MDWPATARGSLTPAPGGLAFVQDLLNTIAAGKPRMPDLLDRPDDAQEWLDAALACWSRATGRPHAPVPLDNHDVEELRALRADLQHVIRAGIPLPEEPASSGPALLTAPATMRLGPDGRAHTDPEGTGCGRVASVILIEMYVAQHTDLWRRLKSCRNDRCAVAFYDRSRNNSGVWHDVRVCGNAANLRASRARRKPPTT
ncbi:CGNR zinc finger domain-containing protein [Streptomyces sp. UNOC14_S4]|uniref:CGNR zinc finger domain-containing protein n=1 Tax=Streptomyces sp. UNOC14_S4 TaxID=2872340 RepID=UPI001E2D1E97|nr:CGNR zinc finger domain-containing protein [Streptomyces sp. UNOC14_S4]MCC3769607.1 CGNR zinc finger domain-containing protein [Streptomyces sp. UNOC14_S4]